MGADDYVGCNGRKTSLVRACRDYVMRVEAYLEAEGAVERSRAAKLAEVGVRFPLPPALEGAKVSDVLRRCDLFRVDKNVVDGVTSGHLIWVVAQVRDLEGI